MIKSLLNCDLKTFVSFYYIPSFMATFLRKAQSSSFVNQNMTNLLLLLDLWIGSSFSLRGLLSRSNLKLRAFL